MVAIMLRKVLENSWCLVAGEGVSSCDEGKEAGGAQGNVRELRARKPGITVKEGSSGREDATLPDGAQSPEIEDSDGFVDF